MRKLILILVAILLVASSLVTLSCGKVEDSGEVAGKTAQLGGLKITVNDVYFDEPWLIVELTLKNEGKETEYFLFAPYSRFYIQDSEGGTYKTMNAHKGKWEEAFGNIALIDLQLEPGEIQELTLQCFDIPEDAKGLKLFCKESAIEGGKRIAISLEVQGEEASEPSSSKATVEPYPDSPGEVVKAFYHAFLVEEDYNKTIEFMCSELRQEFVAACPSEEKLKESLEKFRSDPYTKLFKDVKIESETIRDGKAYVDVTFYYADENEPFPWTAPLIREYGKWKMKEID